MDDEFELKYQRYDSFDKEAQKKKQKEFRRKAYLAAKAKKKDQTAKDQTGSHRPSQISKDRELKEKAKLARRQEYQRQKKLLTESKKREREEEKLIEENEAQLLREQKRFDLLNLTLMKGSEVPPPEKTKLPAGGKPKLRVVKQTP